MSPSQLELKFAHQLRCAGIRYEVEWAKIIPGRRYRFDFALLDYRILVEIQGGTWKLGGHTSGAGIARDCEKSILAQLEGWKVFALCAEHVQSGQGLKWVQEAISRINANRNSIRT